jgi:hypothetical protein
MFPAHIAKVLDAYGVRADTRAALYDLYVSMGSEVLEVFSDIAERVASVADLQPEDTETIRASVVERFLRRNHPRWLEGLPTASLWHPREAEGRASGAAVPLGEIPESVRGIVGRDQPVPDALLMLGRNAHYGGRSETISFDAVARDFDDALAIATAEGQQHTLPGSVGGTTGTFDSSLGVALIWEIQPNVYKPAGDRNRAITKLYRHHRNWHILTLAAALEWITAQRAAVFILRGSALVATHEVNPAKPVSGLIAMLHDRTVGHAIRARGDSLTDATDDDELILLESCVMNHALRRHVLKNGAAGSIQKLDRREEAATPPR